MLGAIATNLLSTMLLFLMLSVDGTSLHARERKTQRAARKEELLDAQMKSLTAKPQEWKTAAQAYLSQQALDAFHAQERSSASLPAATVAAIRLLFVKNRAQSKNPQPSSSGGKKALASLVRQSYPDSLIPADEEPPTFWDKLKQLGKQLWNTFWNWVTGKPTTPPPTATPVIFLKPTSTPIAASTKAPTPTPTTTPTPTPIPTPTPTFTPAFQPLPGGYASYSPYWYGKTYFDILDSNTNGWWHSYQGQSFGMKTYIAAVYNYEIASFAKDPLVREYFTEAFARRYWQSQIDYGPDGAFWYLGGRDMVRLRVLSNVPGIFENEYNFKQSFDEAERILNNSIWKQGISWGSPYEWGNPTEKTKNLLPSFWNVLQNRIVGTQANQILYISPGKDFFIVTQEQVYTLCGNQSCVNPSYLYP